MEKFNFIKYDDSYKEVTEKFKQDEKIKKYLYFSTENSYLIKYNNDIIGFFNLTKFYNNSIDIQLGILEKYRNQGLGTMAYNYITDFAFSLFPESNSIILNIDYQNEQSKKSAIKAGFKLNLEEYEKRQESGEGSNLEPYYRRK